MKSYTTHTSAAKPDSSLDATLNPVELSSKEVVFWGVAFPRSQFDGRTSRYTPVWRTDATIETVVGY